MDGFKNIEIKNFRGIDHLTIDDFFRVNVFWDRIVLAEQFHL